MNIKIGNEKSKKKVKNQPYFPSQYVVVPLWIMEDIISRHKSSAVKTLIFLIARYTLGMRSEYCSFSMRKLSRMTGHGTQAIQDAVKECRKQKYISENMISITGRTARSDGTKVYRLNFLPPIGWRTPMEQKTFFESYNLTREIEDIKLKLLEKVPEENPDIYYLIDKMKSYHKGKISSKDYLDVIHMFER